MTRVRARVSTISRRHPNGGSFGSQVGSIGAGSTGDRPGPLRAGCISSGRRLRLTRSFAPCYTPRSAARSQPSVDADGTCQPKLPGPPPRGACAPRRPDGAPIDDTEDPTDPMDASTLQLIILPAGLIAVLFAIYLARDVLARDTGTPEMQAVAGTIFEGAVAFIRRQYTTIFLLAVVGSILIGALIAWVETPEVADVPSMAGAADRDHDRRRLLRRRPVLDGLGHHRHVRRGPGQRAHRVGRAAQPRRGGPGRDARWGRLRLPRRRPVAPRRVGHLHGLLHLR